jgi:hypothetical protein
MQRKTRAPTIFGAILMLAGAGLYFLDSPDGGRKFELFVIPAMILMGLGAVFAVFGASARDAT